MLRNLAAARALPPLASSQRRGSATRGMLAPPKGFVGEANSPAGEYHCNDFDFEEHAAEVAPLLAHQVAERIASGAAAGGSRRSAPLPAAEPGGGADWERFYRSHHSARVYKERRYLLLEFPLLADSSAPLHVVELGCGCGSSLLPVLRHNSASRATATDISATSIAQMHAAAAAAGVAEADGPSSRRLASFVADSTDPSLARRLAPLAADACLIMFTLSAVKPDEGMAAMMSNAWACLRRGGALLIRDHGWADMVQLRLHAQGRHLGGGRPSYRLQDGTLSYFFTREDLSARAQAAGFQVQECSYVTVVNHNRKTQQRIKRVFVHGVFIKP